MISICCIFLILITCDALNIGSTLTGLIFRRSAPLTKIQTAISDRDVLLQALEGLNYGSKATKKDSENIESYVQALILSSSKKSVKFPADAFALDNGGRNKYQRSLLSGDWELQYTNGPDVISLSKIPSVNLDYVGQIVDTELNTITNLVKASGFLADTEQEVLVNVRQVSPSKVELDFIGTFLTSNVLFLFMHS